MERRLLLSSVGNAIESSQVELAYATRSTPVAHPVAGFKTRLSALNKAHKKSARISHALVAQGSASALGLTPAQMRAAYGVSAINFGGIVGDGTGQTIAIIDAYDYPTAATDLSYFDTYFNLPNPPSFTKVNESGGSTLPGVGSNSIETSLDVEWAHVMAPGASILLVECNTFSEYDLIVSGAAFARSQPNVSVISMSFGAAEQSTDPSTYDSYLASSGTHGVTDIASSGDSGKWTAFGSSNVDTLFPASSINVLAVGGTTLTLNNNTYGSEVGWGNGANSNVQGYGGSGGGLSTIYASQPAFQTNVVSSSITTTQRAVPDISLDASPGSGVPIYDTADYGAVNGAGGGWFPGEIGGTSLSAPLMSGVIAIVNQGRAINGLPALNGPRQTLPAIYNLSATDFNDITSGNNGYAAGPGYDLVTGRGSPIGSLLIPDLVASNSITGHVYVDTNGDGIFDGTDIPLAGYTVYLDKANTGVQGTQPSATTNAAGQYFLADPTGTITRNVRIVSPPGSAYINVPTNSIVSYGNPSQQIVDFAYFPVVYSTATANAHYTLQTDSTGTIDQVAINGSVTDSIAQSLLNTLSFSFTGSGDTLTIDATNGNPIPAAGLTFTGASAGNGLTIIGTASGNDLFSVTSSSLTFDSSPISFSNVSSLVLNPGAGLDSLNVSSGSATVAARSTGHGLLQRNFSSVSIAAGASAIFATALLHADRQLVQTTSLSVLGQLDLGGNDLIVHNGNLPSLTTLLAGGYNNGHWNGTGIASAAASSDTTHLTTLGVLPNTSTFYNAANLFDAQAPLATDILIKYTYYGDTNLDGKVTGSDYTRIDNGYLTQQTGWINGDFNYDAHVDGSDYTLIDNAFNTQMTAL